MYKTIIKPFLFLLNPEKAHHITFSLLRFVFKIPGLKELVRNYYNIENENLEKNLFGLTFKNPVGLAAGFDKDARLTDELSAFGFGFIEIGTLTPLPQKGNVKPRLFRLPQDWALINRMGFNNEGVAAATNQLRNRKNKIIIGGNIGKNKDTPNDDAIKDYSKGFEALYEYVDYFAINVSSPNTPGLRALQEKEPLTLLLNHLQKLNSFKAKRKPILLKIAPDLSYEQLDDIIEIVINTQLDGVIATNTTIDKSNLKTPPETVNAMGAGGLSGKPLKDRSTEVIKYIAGKSMGKFKIIGAGGIFTSSDAIEKLQAGADLLQIYTGFIYEGPSIVKDINRDLVKFQLQPII